MLSNTHNSATSMVSVRAHRAAPYSLRRHRVGWSAVAMLLRRRTKVCLRGARGVCDDTKKCWECCPRCTALQSLWLMPCRKNWQQLVGPPCVWSCCHERWYRLVGRRRSDCEPPILSSQRVSPIPHVSGGEVATCKCAGQRVFAGRATPRVCRVHVSHGRAEGRCSACAIAPQRLQRCIIGIRCCHVVHHERDASGC